jgi:2-dehydropantoate 2-reductase
VPAILLVGPGAIGGLIAWHLQHFAITTVYPHRDDLRLPLAVVSGTGTHPLDWTQVERLDNIDAVVISCKATQVERAAQPLLATLAHCPWLVLCNGMGPQAWLSEQLPGNVLWASTTEGAGRCGAEIRHRGHGETRLGSPLNYPVNASTEQWGRWLVSQTGPLTLRWETDMTTVLWRKLAINAIINPITAVHRCLNGALTEPRWQADIAQLSDDILRIARASQISLPDDLAAAVLGMADATRHNRSSMLTDIEAGRHTEIDTIIGPLLIEADRHGLSVPSLQYWYQAVIRLHPIIR